MNARMRTAAWIFCATSALVLVLAPLAVVAQSAAAPESAAQARRQAQAQSLNTPAPSEKDVADVQEQLLHLLRLSPTMTAAVAADPSLLADEAYVVRSNPELAQFMASHPDIARNPEFYLFSKLDPSERRRDKALERVVWPELMSQWPSPPSASAEVMNRLTPMILFPVFFAAVVWIIHIFVQSRRWNRTFRQQSEVHGRLIDKFSSTQELAAYMQTEAGQRFLAFSSAPMGADPGIRMPNTVSRVLTSLSVGIVMALLGVGFLLLRNAGPDMLEPMLITGILLLMPGLGFILSAGVTWVLAHRLGLMPEKEIAETKASAPFDSQDRR
jgi:hypothetical protein